MALNSVSLFFDILLPDVLDYCSLTDLLLRAMPVCRSWREHVINHWTYWENPTLLDDSGFPESLESLFLLRLSRSRDRPIRVQVWLKDSHVLVTTLAEHLHHINSLLLYCTTSLAPAVFQSFRAYPAPLLKQLGLYFYDKRFPPTQDHTSHIVRIPRDLFSSYAPALYDVNLYNIALPTGEDFPACLANVTTLVLQYTPRLRTVSETAPLRALPDISVHLPKLEQMTVGPQVVFAAPALWQAETWRHVLSVTFLWPELWDNRSVAHLPLGAVPRLIVRCPMATDLTGGGASELVATMQGPLCVAIPWESFTPSAALQLSIAALRWRMTVQGAHAERWVETHVPRGPSAGLPLHLSCALQQAPLARRIVKLSLSLSDWDSLVGGGYFTVFPALETLVLALVTDASNSFWKAKDAAALFRLSCPRLHHLALTHACLALFPRAMDLALVAAFVRGSLPRAQIPLVLELKELAIEGSHAEHSDVFSSVVHSPRDPTDNAKWE